MGSVSGTVRKLYMEFDTHLLSIWIDETSKQNWLEITNSGYARPLP